MRILQMLPELELGGVETFVVLLSRELKKIGQDVFVVSAGGRLVDELKVHEIPHIFLPVKGKDPFSIFYSAIRLSFVLKRLNIDVVHAHSRVPDWIAYFSSLISKVPFVVSAHAFYSPHWGSRIVSKADRVVCDSFSVGDYMVERLGVYRKKIRVVYNGIEVSRFSGVSVPFRGGKITIGTVGRLAPSKGQAVLLKACASLIEKGYDIRVMVVGDGPLMGELKELARTLGIEEHTVFTGFRSDIPAVLSEIDIFVHSSLIPEPLSMALIEAMASGRPCVASGVGGFREVVVDGLTGYLVEPGDVDVLALALKRMLDNPRRAFEMGREGLKRVKEKFSSDSMARGMLEVYNEFKGVGSKV